jgi:hypothetical protein
VGEVHGCLAFSAGHDQELQARSVQKLEAAVDVTILAAT